MNNFITSLLSYPFTHISQIKKLTKQQLYLMQSPIFYPAYPLLLIISAVSNLILSAWMIYYFIHSQIHSCYSGVTLGIQILACIYPLYQLMMFFILLVAIAKAQYNIIKMLLILSFTIVLTSFGFGGLGIVFSCMVHSYDQSAIPSSFLTENYFIQIIVYAMLVFVLLYLILVPLTVWLQDRRDKNKQRTDCQCCLLFMYIMFQFILFIGFIVFLAIAIGGVPILFYLLNGISKTQPMTQQAFFGMAINSIIAPYVIFGLVLFFTKVLNCGGQQEEMRTSLDESKQLQTQQTEQQDTNKSNNHNDLIQLKRKSINLDDQIIPTPNSDTKRQVLLESHLNKDFGEDEFGSRNTKNKASLLDKSTLKK